MKKLNTKRMRTLLESGKRNIRRNKIRRPRDGGLVPLFSKEFLDGSYYQVDYIFDTRRNEKSYVVVYGFKPPRTLFAKMADYILWQDYERRNKTK